MLKSRRNYWLDANGITPHFYPEASVHGYCMSLIAKEQPEYVCRDCAFEFGYWTSFGDGVSTGKINSLQDNHYHEGICDCCGKPFSLTHVKNYGYFYDGWQNKINESN